MYELKKVIPNPAEEFSLISEVAFHPSGSFFVATFQDNNEFRVYDTENYEVLKSYRSSESMLDGPHGIVVTEKYIIVSNMHNLQKPSQLNVYAIDSTSISPVSTYQTPFPELREAHSLVISGNVLVASYCSQQRKLGALVSYEFDPETGKISGVLDEIHQCFQEYGASKGLSFCANDTKLLVAINSFQKHGSKTTLQALKFFIRLIRTGKFSELLKYISPRFHNKLKKNLKRINGFITIDISKDGKFEPEASSVVARPYMCRLENIQAHNGKVLITDTINSKTHLFESLDKAVEDGPYQTMDLGKCLPHGAKLSPDERTMVITTFGLEKKNQAIIWGTPLTPRSDNIFVYERLWDQPA